MDTLSLSAASNALQDAAERSRIEAESAHAMTRSRTKLVIDRDATCVFFASLSLRLDLLVDWNVDTAATDGKAIYFNPEFILGLSADERRGVICHEIMHCSNKHFARRGNRNAKLWNIACDLAINSLILNVGLKLPEGCLVAGQGMFSAMPIGLSAEEYYHLFQQEFGDDGEKFPDNQSGGSESDPGGCGGVCEPRKSDGSDGVPSDGVGQKQLDAEWTTAVSAAIQASEKFGSLHGGLKRMVTEILTPVVDWKDPLHEFVTRNAKNDMSWQRPNKRFTPAGLYLPSRKSLEIGHLFLAIDVSGSITQELLNRFASELNAIASIGVMTMTIIYHDSSVCKVQDWEESDGPIELELVGGGGTDHNCVFDWIESFSQESPTALICLTDLHSSFPKVPPMYPVLWASITNAPHPFGERIDIPRF